MSTKTTFKRIALVAVAAMGFGVLTSVSPASATVTTGFSLNTSSITVVETSGTGYGVFEVTLTDRAGDSTQLEDTESLRARVVAATLPKGLDTTTATSDLLLGFVTAANYSPTSGTASDAISDAGTTTLAGNSDTGSYEDLAAAGAGRSLTTATATALLKVSKASGKALDKGTYEIQIQLFDNVAPASGNVIATSTVKFTVVSSSADSGAVLTASVSGIQRAGAAVGVTPTSFVSATLRDANGGLVRSNANAAPAVTGTILTSATTPVNAVDNSGLTPIDDGGANDWEDALGDEAGMDGVYGFTGTMASSIATATGTFRARYGAATATATVIFGSAITALWANAAPEVSATGLVATATTTPWRIPTTTKSATLTVLASNGSAALVNYPVTFTLTYSNVGAGDATPVAATPKVVYTDASGYASITVTNNNPVNGATATIALTGFTTAATDQVIEWAAPGRQTAISVSPSAQRVATGTSTVVTATVTDRFGAPVAGVVLQPSLSTTSASYTTAPMATVTTNASGQATVTLTAGANLTSDTITFTDISGLASSANVTYSYRTTVDAIASFLGYYSLDESLASTASTPVPASGITNTDGTYLAITKARNNSRIISAGGTVSDLVGIRVQALTSASAGAVSRPVVVTVSEGAFIRGAVGTPVTSRTLVTSSTGFVDFIVGSNKTGANVVTITAGSVSTTVAFWTTNAAADARYVTLTGATTATANADAIPFTATVTDRYGNPVSGVNLTIQASGVGVMGGGSTLQTFQTNSAGTFTFTGTSLIAAGGTATFTASAPSTAEFASAAGISGATSVDSTLTAGRSSSSVTVTFAPGENAAAAQSQAAADAAAEATDAANAATDAANAAAEAADAATAAAQDAADAVAALSTQVSEMINALKKQITALTNLVIKIQKKVRA